MPNLPNLLAKRICLPAHPPIVRLTEDRRAGHGEFVATTQLIPQKPLHRGDYGLFWVVMRGPLPHQAGESGLQKGVSRKARASPDVGKTAQSGHAKRKQITCERANTAEIREKHECFGNKEVFKGSQRRVLYHD